MDRNNEVTKVCLPKVLRSYRDEVSNDCYLDITDTPDEDMCYQLNFHITNISISYADELFSLIYDKLNETKSIKPELAF